MKTRLFILLLTPILYVASGSSRPWYTGKSPLRQAEYQKEKLTDCNLCADSDVVNVTSTGIHPGEGARPSICLDLANRHNRAGKKYAVYRADSTGEAVRTGSVEKPVWGVVWGYRDPQNHHALLLRGGADDFYGYQPPELQFSIITVADGDTVFHARWERISSTAIHPETDYNRLHIVPTGGGYEISLGQERECRIGFCRDDRLFGDLAGIYVGCGACVQMKEWSVTPHEYPERHVIWEADDLAEYLRQSAHPIEGIYEFLQASSTSYNTRLGGNYRLVMVASGPNYLLVYESGAQRFEDRWQTGMVKAVLQPTGLSNLFNVTWYDAEHKPLKEGVKAIVADNGVLTIHFSREGVILEWNRATPSEEGYQYQQQKQDHSTPVSPIAL